jgi:hypothetical protein
MKVIMHQRKFKMNIPEGIKAFVQIRKVLDFNSMKINFDQDGELSKSLELFGSLLVTNGKQDMHNVH